MTKRFFLNNSGGGSGKKASDFFKEGLKRGDAQSKMTPTERNKQMVSDKLGAMLKKASGGISSSYSMLGSTRAPEKQESESVKQLKAQLAEKRAKRENKKLQEELRIEAKYFSGMQGGRIDSKGNIYNAHNQLVAIVNVKNGKIVAQTGVTIGKYVNNSPSAEFAITRYIAKSNNQAARGGIGSAPEAFDAVTGGIDATAPKQGSIWGKKKKDAGWW